MAIQRNFVYIAHTLFNQPMFVVDVSDPTQPRVVSKQTIGAATIKLVAAGGLLYAMAENALTVLDLSYPAVPRVVGVHGLSRDHRARNLLVGRSALYVILQQGISVLPLHGAGR